MQNQNLQQSFSESNALANDITNIHLAKNRFVLNGLVDALEGINHSTHNISIAMNSKNYAKNFLLT